MAYGDALGFLYENTGEKPTSLRKFNYKYNDYLSIDKQEGQYSYITELMLIMIKCMIDDSKDLRLVVDYKGFYDELMLWKYYRHGSPEGILTRIQANNYYKSSFYWEDKNCSGINRVIPILLANNNYYLAEMEVYKNVIYFNRQAEIVFTGLLILRTGYLILQNPMINKDELLQELKNYLINLQLKELNRNMRKNFNNKYNIQFEKEKIQYLIELDRYKRSRNLSDVSNNKIILYAIENYFILHEGGKLNLNNLPYKYKKEIISIAYSYWGMCGKGYDMARNSLKDESFICEMGKFLYRLRKNKINRKVYPVQETEIDIFKLEPNQMIKHPILNAMRVIDKEETDHYIKVLVQTKSCIYTFIKQRNKTG